MEVVSLHAKREIATFLRRNPFLYVYHLGDLDDFFWPYTVWYALKNGGEIAAMALLYTRFALPVLQAIGDAPLDALAELLRSSRRLLPRRFYAHLSGDLARVFAEDHDSQCHGTFYKMALADRSRLHLVDTSDIIPCTSSDADELAALYGVSYPSNSFDPRMLETGRYYGLRRGGRLACVAGVHVVSPQYSVAALGNITTHPDYRGQGLATRATARLCQALAAEIEYIGLNVQADNTAAIACYERLGFVPVATYGEYTFELK